ncbi:MAG: hypothetical protein ROO76_22435 [Terriglobia bacterium]|jgi:hypothetical protein|nr:hypothetical protein [Terriglobia bacterium]
MRKIPALLMLILAIAVFNACESKKETPTQSETAKPQAEAPEYETGRLAFQKLYVAARGFAPDIQPFRLQSSYTKGAPVEEGKEGIWHASFASPSKRELKSYTWSGVSGPDMPDRGVSHGTEDDYNPSNSATRVFDLQFLKVDTDKAIKVANEHGGAALMKKDPNQPVNFLLDWNGKNQLIWHVIYGESRSTAPLVVDVDASSGNYIGKGQ